MYELHTYCYDVLSYIISFFDFIFLSYIVTSYMPISCITMHKGSNMSESGHAGCICKEAFS